MSYLHKNRRLLPLNVLLIAGALVWGACTQVSADSANTDHPGWTNSEYRVARDGFFDGYGTPDAFGNCTFEWVVDNYSPEETAEFADDTYAMQAAIDAASDACSHEL